MPSSLSFLPPQTMCAPGTFSPGGWAFPNCTMCPAGSACPLLSAAPQACPAGSYSLGGAGTCTSCAQGRFGSATGLATADCSGVCTAGYVCALGATSQTLCGAGTYSTAQSGFCNYCPPGQFGSSSGLTSSTCSGACNASAGSHCPLGSSSTSGEPCPPGTYSNATGTLARCVVCPVEAPYSPAGSRNLTACVPCLDATACPDGTRGVFACPNTSWSPWVDRSGVEGVNSCLMLVQANVAWSSANALCNALSPSGSVHLLTTKQVGAAGGGRYHEGRAPRGLALAHCFFLSPL